MYCMVELHDTLSTSVVAYCMRYVYLIHHDKLIVLPPSMMIHVYTRCVVANNADVY